jgi:hypothetical protein
MITKYTTYFNIKKHYIVLTVDLRFIRLHELSGLFNRAMDRFFYERKKKAEAISAADLVG